MKVHSVEIVDKIQIKNIRKSAKYCNFLLEFGGGARNLAKNFIARNWTYEECMDYINSNSLKIENADIRIVENKGTEDERTIVHRERGLTDEQYTVGKDIRKKFFETYPGLKLWIDEKIEEAQERGFVRSAFGARRHIPQMLYEGPDNDGKSYANQAVNSPVQNFEAIVVGSAMVRFQMFRKELNLKSRLFVNVHDELGYYIAEGEEDVMFDIMKIMEYDHPESEGVPLTVEGTLSNPKDKENPSYWGFGSELRKEEAYETYGSRRERIKEGS